MPKSAIHFVKKQIRFLERSKKINQKLYTVLYFLLASINLTIVAVTVAALIILLQNKGRANNATSIVMASITATITLFIFIFNIINIIYKNYMKWGVYKEAIDKIELEYMQYANKEAEYKKLANPKAKALFEKQCLLFYEEAIAFKRSKSKRKMLSKAIVGDYYE